MTITPARKINAVGLANEMINKPLPAAKIAVKGNRGVLNGRSISGYFFRKFTIDKDAQNRTNIYPALEIKLRKSTRPMMVIKPLMSITKKMDT